jgi:hypothetical protein
MKHPFRLLSLCVLVAVCAGGLAAGQSRPTPEEPNHRLPPQKTPMSANEILRRALDARGGEAAAAHIQKGVSQ